MYLKCLKHKSDQPVSILEKLAAVDELLLAGAGSGRELGGNPLLELDDGGAVPGQLQQQVLQPGAGALDSPVPPLPLHV